MNVIDTIISLYTGRGRCAYAGERVSQLEHARQTAYLALRAEAPDTLVTAALLHDIGHVLHDQSETTALNGFDLHHEQIGTRWLQAYFDDAVVAPIRMHVAAKRYLTAVEPQYLARLSRASLLSLSIQGGSMTPAEVLDFELRPFAATATRLRRWDDQAKIAGLAVPPLLHYLPYIERSVLVREQA